MPPRRKKKTQTEVEDYIDAKMYFKPRFLKSLSQLAPEFAARFADYYEVGHIDKNLKRKHKELIFTAIGIATKSPRCIVHVIPAIKAGATDGEILEAAAVGFLAAGFYPNSPGIPYAFEYATKTLEIAQKYRKGEPWEYLISEKYRG